MPLKAHTHRPTFTGSAAESVVESANSAAEAADNTTNSVIVGRLSLSNMFDILSPLESADFLQSAGGKSAQWVQALSIYVDRKHEVTGSKGGFLPTGSSRE